jgi:hypothetical protein
MVNDIIMKVGWSRVAGPTDRSGQTFGALAVRRW